MYFCDSGTKLSVESWAGGNQSEAEWNIAVHQFSIKKLSILIMFELQSEFNVTDVE